jgi:hypothetical protein
MTRLMDLIHEVDPYAGFDPGPYPSDFQGWASDDPLFRVLFEKLRPRRIAEVGTWKGASALYMAHLARELAIDCEIVCIDTWLGSVEHWFERERPHYFKSLNLRHGYPTLYYTFLANVVRTHMTDTIVPFPIASAGAARFMRARGVTFDLIYIDAAHDYEEVRLDVELFWPLVRPGGVMFGDDFTPQFSGLRRAVEEFAAGRNLRLQTNPNSPKWLIQR